MKTTMAFATLLWLACFQLLGTVNADDKWLYTENAATCDWRRADHNQYKICNQPPQPNFYPNSGLSRVFNVMVRLDEYENDYYDKRVRAMNLGAYPNMALNAVSHIFGKFFVMGLNGQWVKRGEFGPLWMRRTTETNNDYRMFWKLPGFVQYDTSSKLATFRFFITPPISGDGADPVITEWRNSEPAKQSFELGITLASTCLNGFYTKNTTEATKPTRCVTGDTAMSYSYMDHYAMKHTNVMTGTVEKAELKSTTFELVYRWTDADCALYTKARLSGAEDQRAKLKVLLFDSNPASHGQDGVNDQDQKNIRMRAILAVFPYYPSWDDAHNKPQETYSFDLGWGGWKEEVLTDFLYKYAAYDHQGQDSAYYASWNASTGLSMAISMCMKSGDITDRDGGCREWQIHPVIILDRSPQPTTMT